MTSDAWASPRCCAPPLSQALRDALESEQEIAVRQGRFRLEAGAPAQP